MINLLFFLILLLLQLIAGLVPHQLGDLSHESLESLAGSLNGRFALSSTASLLYQLPEAKSKHHLSAYQVRNENDHKELRCSPIVLRVSDTSTLFKDTSRPQVLISGEVHGNERVGPVASIMTARLLVWGAECEIERKEQSCAELVAINVTKTQRSWLAYLATKRDTYILPAANCMGYLKNTREDLGVDPNRDFSYCRSNTHCFKSLTAQTFRALFANSLIQLVTTFHGGMEAIGYEWGTTNKQGAPNDKSPDHNSHHQIASILSKYSGGFGASPPYRYNTMNAIVYPVEGSMEDWMYASAWDKKQLKRCVGDNSFTTPIDNGRSEVFLVETSNSKRPSLDIMGSLTNVLDPALKLPVNGHASRNIRLALASIDLVEPYVCVSKLQLDGLNGVGSVHWYVGGSSSVASTFLTVLPAPVPLERLLSRDYQGSKSYLHDLIDDELTDPPVVKTMKFSNTRWSVGYATSEDIEPSSLATESFQLPKQAGFYWVVAQARVDEAWGVINQGNPSGLSPQSHLANSRTNKDWKHQISSTFLVNSTSGKTKVVTDKKKVQGRLYWPSEPIVIEMDSAGKAQVISEVFDCRWWSRSNGKQNRETTPASVTSTPLRKKDIEIQQLDHHQKQSHDKQNVYDSYIPKSMKEGPKKLRMMILESLVGIMEHVMYYLGILYLFICLIFVWYCYCRMKQTVKLKSYE